jgi:CheY-like chemotaxis protein
LGDSRRLVALAAIVLSVPVMNLATVCMAPPIVGPMRTNRPVRMPARIINTILVVEDDADMCLGYQLLLRSHHYTPVFASDAATAIARSKSHNPDLIILDLGLPVIDGFELLAHFGPAYVSTVPIIVVSCRSRESHKARALKAGAVNYLQKPWCDDELLEMIDRYSADPW